jgi:iron complex transport system ATP-binding protein
MVLMGTSSSISPVTQPGPAEREAAFSALERLGMLDYAERDYMRISGGERQLVLIARALAQRTRTLLMDEPTANLDFGNQMRTLASIRALAEEGYTVIISTHHPEHAYLFSHSILALKGGAVVAQGAPRDILNAELIEQLYGVSTTVEGLCDDAVRVCIPNNIPIRKGGSQ